MNATSNTTNETTTSSQSLLNTPRNSLLLGIRFLQENPSYYPYFISCTLGVLIGMIGNSLICGAIIVTRELQSTSNIIVFNLALADFAISLMVDSFTSVGILVGPIYFYERPVLCKIVGAICLIVCETSLMNIGLIAFNRYIKICQNGLYNKFFTKKKTCFYCFICWMIGILINIPLVSGWSGYYYDLKTRNCVWDRLASESYSFFFPLSSIVLPCVIIAVFYIKIFFFATAAKASAGSGDLKTSLRIAKGLFSSYALFVFCWLPYGMIVMVDIGHDQLPKEYHAYGMMFAHLNSGFNPLLYAVSNPLYQKGYANLFHVITFRKFARKKGSKNSVTKKTQINDFTKF